MGYARKFSVESDFFNNLLNSIFHGELREITIEQEGNTAPGVETCPLSIIGGSPRITNVDLVAIGIPGYANTYGIEIGGNANARIKNVNITMATIGTGVMVYPNSLAQLDDITISGITGPNSYGVVAKGAQVEIRNLNLVGFDLDNATGVAAEPDGGMGYLHL